MNHEQVQRDGLRAGELDDPLRCRIGAVSYLNTKPLVPVDGESVRSAERGVGTESRFRDWLDE